jgi:hypothetical protein
MLIALYFYSSVQCAVPNMAVLCSALISCFPGMLLGYFVNDFEMFPLRPPPPSGGWGGGV